MTRPYSRSAELRRHILAHVASGDLSREQAALDAGVSERTINRWMKTASVKRPLGGHNRAAEIRKLKKRHTKAVIISTFNQHPRVPSNLLDVSLRTVYRLRKRYQGEVLNKTFVPERDQEGR